MIPTSKSSQKRKTNAPRSAEQASKTEPVPLLSKFAVDRCRECGEPIGVGERIWWVRNREGHGPSIHFGTGTAHLACGWTLKNGTVHPLTAPYIQDIPAPPAKPIVVQTEFTFHRKNQVPAEVLR